MSMSRILAVSVAWVAMSGAMLVHGIHSAKTLAIRRDGADVWAEVK
jgi:hypothetical protein